MIEATWKHFIELEAGTWNNVLMECLKSTETQSKTPSPSLLPSQLIYYTLKREF